MTQPTNFALAWKRETEIVEFPSGMCAEMTRPDALSILTESSEIPDSLFKLIQDSQTTGANPMEGLEASQMREFIKLMMFLSEQLAVRHFVNPRIVANPDYDAGEISLDDIRFRMGMDDKQFLTAWAMSGGSSTDALMRFREEQTRRVLAPSNGEGV